MMKVVKKEVFLAHPKKVDSPRQSENRPKKPFVNLPNVLMLT